MSIQNTPSEKILEELANQFFKAVPGSGNNFDNLVPDREKIAEKIPQIISPPEDLNLSDKFTVRKHTERQNAFSIDNPQTSLHDPFFSNGQIPKSVAGDGKSPLYANHPSSEVVSVASPSTDISNSNDSLHGFIQSTEQAYKKHYTVFDINNPQTSLPDTAFSNGQIPKSVAGDGKQPGLINNSIFQSAQENAVFPAVHQQTSELSNLTNLLNEVNQFRYQPQLPLSEAATSFYFVNPSAYIDPVKIGYPGTEPLNGAFPTLSHHFFDVEAVRKDFPVLNEYVNGKRLVWLDNAATTQKPQSVIDRLSYFYQHENSNIHRAAHELAARATDAYEEARTKVQRFLNAGSVNEIVFTRGTTEAINLVAASWGEQNLGENDEIIISHLEHHANIVPWQLLSKKKGFKINVIPVNDNGELLFDEYVKLLSSKTRLVSFTHVSNALGTITPAKQIIELAHSAGAKVLLDGAQSVSHLKVDLQYLNPDFFVFSGHKVFAPTGIGVLYGKEELLNSLQPYQGGGNMIQDVTFEKTIFHNAPARFEAGTGNIADAVGLGAAIDYVQRIGIENIGRYEHELLEYATYLFKQIPGLKLIGTAKDKASVLSFTLKGYTNDEVGKTLNEHGIAVRTGHHCAQPILRRLGYESSVRPSLAFYNTRQEIDLLANVIYKLAEQNR